MAYLLLVALVVLSVALLILATLRGDKRQEFLWKPLSTLLVIAVCLLSWTRPNVAPAYTWALTVGLLLSLGGDVALLFPSERAFLLGVACFLLAHVAYIVAFGWLGGFGGPLWPPAVLLAIVGVAFYLYLYPHLGRLRLPVGLYALVISVMVLAAISTIFSQAFAPLQAWLAILGALLFYVSDMILASARFVRPFRGHRAFNLAAYYAGQLLIALSAAYALGG